MLMKLALRTQIFITIKTSKIFKLLQCFKTFRKIHKDTYWWWFISLPVNFFQEMLGLCSELHMEIQPIRHCCFFSLIWKPHIKKANINKLIQMIFLIFFYLWCLFPALHNSNYSQVKCFDFICFDKKKSPT